MVDCINRLNLTYAAASEMFNVSAASVKRWLRLDREEDSLESEHHAGGRTCGIKDGQLASQVDRLPRLEAW